MKNSFEKSHSSTLDIKLKPHPLLAYSITEAKKWISVVSLYMIEIS
jgi:hypothetical protein